MDESPTLFYRPPLRKRSTLTSSTHPAAMVSSIVSNLYASPFCPPFVSLASLACRVLSFLPTCCLCVCVRVFFFVRYEGPRKMRVVLGNMHGNNADVEAESSLLHRMLRGSLDSLEEPCLVNRNPRWNAKVHTCVFSSHTGPICSGGYRVVPFCRQEKSNMERCGVCALCVCAFVCVFCTSTVFCSSSVVFFGVVVGIRPRSSA